jgi:hypothetical protein
MLKEALEYLRENLIQQDCPQPVDIETPDGRRVFIGKGGEQIVIQSPPKPLRLVADTIAGFCDLCGQHKAVQVIVRSASVEAYLDREGRERINLLITGSEEWSALASLVAPCQDGIDPKTLCRNLRSDLRNCFDESDRTKLLKQFGSIKVADINDGMRVTSRTQDTMGASINQVVSPEVDMPDEVIVFRVRVFNDIDMRDDRFPVAVYTEPNLDKKTWILSAIPDSMKAAQQDATQLLVGRIANRLPKGITIHY